MDNPVLGSWLTKSVNLGWAGLPLAKQLSSKLAWITTIADPGNCSKEIDAGKSNYQAGTDFENIVRLSLEFLVQLTMPTKAVQEA